MQLTHLSVKNFKGLREIDVPLSQFVCLIGENNAGKSSFLQALLLFVEPRKLDPSMYFDPTVPITITVRIEGISEADLSLIKNDEHRSRFRETLQNGAIKLVRRFDSGGTGRLRWIARVPTGERFNEDFIDALLKGKKPGGAFAEEVGDRFPEVKEKLDPRTTQTQVRALIKDLAEQIPEEQKQDVETDLLSGIENSVRSIMPEPIYISAVKDLADEIATKDSASFGKLLGILLSQIAPVLEGTEEIFKNLNKNLNRIVKEDGSVLDNRLEAVRNIETVVQTYIRENFPRIGLDIRIPPPELKTVLSGAEIWVDDGVPGLIESKGDGLKRTVTFSILRAYVELKRKQGPTQSEGSGPARYLFLFEEPELYLHPTAQGILFGALREIARTNHVVVSTHSPVFFSADIGGTFIKLAKTLDEHVALKPFARALCVDLSSLDNKTRFQIISYETNNTAFFYSTVVLVEGDSELLVIPHIARILNPDWTVGNKGVALCKVGGKGNIARYREFFAAFDTRVCVIGDLDCLLDGFDQLAPSGNCEALREELLQAIDEVAQNDRTQGKLRSKDIRDMQQSRTRREQLHALIEVIDKRRAGSATDLEVRQAEEEFFSDLPTSKRRQVLEDSGDARIIALKRDLLSRLREQYVFILERGTIESYYPASVTGPDNPSRAIDFCDKVRTREDVLRLCHHVVGTRQTDAEKEFLVILSSIFGEE